MSEMHPEAQALGTYCPFCQDWTKPGELHACPVRFAVDRDDDRVEVPLESCVAPEDRTAAALERIADRLDLLLAALMTPQAHLELPDA